MSTTPRLLEDGSTSRVTEDGATVRVLNGGTQDPEASLRFLEDNTARFNEGGTEQRALEGYVAAVVTAVAGLAVSTPAVSGSGYTIDLCAAFVKVTEAVAYEFRGVIRHLEAGDWELSTTPAGIGGVDTSTIDSLLIWYGSPAKIIFAGLVRPTEGADAGIIRHIDNNGTTLTFTGIDLFGVLRQRQAWPTPTTDPPWADSHDVETGVGSDVAAEFIEANIGVSALSERQIADLSVVNPTVGLSSTWSARLQPLDLLVGRVCRESGIVCRASMPTPGTIVFTLGSPTDRSAQVVLSDQGDLEIIDHLMSPVAGSFILAAGQGELTDRSFAQADSGAEGLSRVEVVYENVNVTTAAGLASAANVELAEASSGVSVAAVLAEGAAQRLRYLTDYDVGDVLGIEVDGVRYTASVERVRFDLTEDRTLVTPVLGRSTSDQTLRLIRGMSDLADRFDTQLA
jgi:hypothetical protein